jgi:hypothetical protein
MRPTAALAASILIGLSTGALAGTLADQGDGSSPGALSDGGTGRTLSGGTAFKPVFSSDVPGGFTQPGAQVDSSLAGRRSTGPEGLSDATLQHLLIPPASNEESN